MIAPADFAIPTIPTPEYPATVSFPDPARMLLRLDGDRYILFTRWSLGWRSVVEGRWADVERWLSSQN